VGFLVAVGDSADAVLVVVVAVDMEAVAVAVAVADNEAISRCANLRSSRSRCATGRHLDP